jgi:hypothetical protein
VECNEPASTADLYNLNKAGDIDVVKYSLHILRY